MSIQDPFHEGELAVQARAGETDNAVLNSRMIAASIMPQALPFLAKQPWAILGGLGEGGHLWCSALVGAPGFMEPSPEGTEIDFDLNQSPFHPADPLLGSLAENQALGALFIELAIRRRLRVNGRVAVWTAERLRLSVEESLPNCPKFIQSRAFEGHGPSIGPSPSPRRGLGLGPQERRRLREADTFFLATAHPSRGVDVSHRGGKPGFMEVIGDSLLRVPDYPGNGLFQSFGNLEVDGRSGWLVPDFTTGGLLHLTGHARVVWDAPDSGSRTAGTHRFLELAVTAWRWTPPVQGTPRWRFVEYSPLNP